MIDLNAINAVNTIPVYDSSPWAVPPMPINAYSMLSVPAYWRAVNFLADNLSSFPRSVYRDGAKSDTPHPLDVLLKRRPNNYQNSTALWRTLFYGAVHFGNGYIRVERAGIGSRPVALHNLQPDDLLPFRYDRDDGRGLVQYFFHRPTKNVYPGVDVIHLQALSHDGMAGLNPAAIHATTFQRAATVARFQTKFLQKGTVLKGSVEVPGSMTTEQMETLRGVLRRQFYGPDAEQDVLILTDNAKLNNTTLSPHDSQLIQQSADATKAIAQATGVPPPFLFELSEGKYNDAIAGMGEFVVRYVFRPWIEQAEDELTAKLLTEAEQDAGLTIRLNPDALLRGDTAAQVTTTAAAVNAGLRSRNEGRAILGLPADADPSSDKLKTLGDSTPATAAPPAGTTAPAGGEAPDAAPKAEPLNGAQITAAIDIMDKLRAGTLVTDVALALLVAAGLPPDTADGMVKATNAAPALPAPRQNAAPDPAHAFAALAPVIAAACERVDRKTEKAFANAAGKTGQDRVVWSNVFSAAQQAYVAEALAPVADALAKLGGPALDVPAIAERYGFAVRRRGSTGEVQSLADVANFRGVVEGGVLPPPAAG